MQKFTGKNKPDGELHSRLLLFPRVSAFDAASVTQRERGEPIMTTTTMSYLLLPSFRMLYVGSRSQRVRRARAGRRSLATVGRGCQCTMRRVWPQSGLQTVQKRGSTPSCTAENVSSARNHATLLLTAACPTQPPKSCGERSAQTPKP
jgi:hypothetical protein